ncbi:hypothetical protein [Chitinophaga eiseniae]|uniref:hypothetical protein n=1 Tax=Chitinophaga eiseniae TaxID=634771 RepID=UPI0013562DAF|nr:hypothetical protein [Chitinophaga eiseniae]
MMAMAGLQIPAAAICAPLALHEQVNGYQWTGILLIIVAVAGMNIPAVKNRNGL